MLALIIPALHARPALACLDPASVNGTAWVATNGTVLCGGTYAPTSLYIPAGVTVYALDGTLVVIQASNWIEVAGTLNADGAGGAGGAGCNNSAGSPGTAGAGEGAGAGGSSSSDEVQGGGAGGGGGFGCGGGMCGGNGGSGSEQSNAANGGGAYDVGNSFSLPQPTGSGGGGGGCGDNPADADNAGSGGNGGGSLALIAPQVQIDQGAVLTANGADGAPGDGGGAGGGGSGGNIFLMGSQFFTNAGVFSVNGGAGHAGGGDVCLGGGGGGGGGGRVKIAALSSCSGGTFSLAGGAGGPKENGTFILPSSSAGSNGLDGTQTCELLQQPTVSATASPSTVDPGVPTTISLAVTNPEMYSLSYQYDCTGSGNSYSASTSATTSTCSWTYPGAHTILAKATVYNTGTLIDGTPPGGRIVFTTTLSPSVTVTDVLTVSLSTPRTGSLGAAVTPLVASITNPSALVPYTLVWSYGDGNTQTVVTDSTTNTQSHSYESPGAVTVTLRVTDALGAVASTTANVTIAEVDPKVLIGALPAPINALTSAAFSATATSVSTLATAAGFTYTFAWGDGMTSTVAATARNGTGVPASHTYSGPGSYRLAVTATDMFGGVSSQAETVTVLDPFPSLLFMVNATTIPIGSPLQAMVSASSAYAPADAQPFTYLFTWGDGQTTTLTGGSPQTPTHVYEIPGSYTVQVKVTDFSGAAASASTGIITATEVVPTVVINAPDPLPLVAQTSATFSASATSVSTVATSHGFSFVFNWGDGDLSTPTGAGSATHVYAEPGTYMLTVTATDMFGGVGSTTTAVMVGDAPPTVTFGNAPYAGVVASPITVTATANSPVASQEAGTFTFNFTWGDGQSSTLMGAPGVIATHTYDAAGTYAIALSVTDSLSTSSETVTATATIAGVAPIITGFTHPNGVAGALTPFTVTVTDVSHADTAAGFTIAWNFGDGTPPQTGLNLTSVTHQYAAPGMDTVTVTATDENGQQATANAMITVRDTAPVVSLGAAQSVALNTPVTLTPTLTPFDSSWTYVYAWTLGDGSHVATPTATESFSRLGTYTVSLTATDPYGGVGTGSVMITVINEPPVASSVVLAPANPLALQALTLSYTYSEAEHIAESGTTIRWYVNGNGDVTYNDMKMIPVGIIQRNQSWYAVVTPKDGTDFGAPVTSNTVTVADPPPVVASISISPAAPKHADSLQLSYTYSGAYPESGTTIAWTRNGAAQSALANLKTVPSPLKKGDSWVATVTPSDGTATGVPVSTSVVVQDTAPVLSPLSAVAMMATGTTTPVSWTASATDVDGDTITYDCSVPSQDLGPGPSYTYAFPFGMTLVTCTASDGTLVTTGTFTVTISDQLPTLSLTANQTVDPGLVTVTATGHDALDRPLTYTWTALSGPPIAQPGATSSATFSFTTFAAGSYSLQCTVSNGVAQVSKQTTVTVTQLAPLVNLGGGPRLMLAGETIALDGSHSVDPNEGTLTYKWNVVSGAAFLSSATDPVTQLTATTGGQIQVALTVDDGALSATGTLVIDVWGLTAPAAPIAVAGPNQTVPSGTLVTLDGTSSFDPNGQALTYAWTLQSGPDVTLSGAASANPTFTAPGAGSDVFALTVSDSAGSSQSLVTIASVAAGSDAAPTAVISPADTLTQLGSATVLDGSGSSSPTHRTLTQQWSWVSGPYVNLSGTNQPRCSVTAYDEGEAVLQLVVSDGVLSSPPAFAHVHVRTGTLSAPTASATGPAEATADTSVILDGSGSTDPNGLPLLYQWTQLSGPSVAIHTAETPRASFVPSHAGAYVFQLNISDWVFTASAQVTVMVGAGDLPIAVATGPASGFAGGLITLNGSASHDPMDLPLTYAWRQLSGPSVRLTQADSVTPSFEATETGTYELQLLVSNGPLTSAPAKITVAVVQGGGCTQGAPAGWLAALVLLACVMRRRKLGLETNRC